MCHIVFEQHKTIQYKITVTLKSGIPHGKYTNVPLKNSQSVRCDIFHSKQ